MVISEHIESEVARTMLEKFPEHHKLVDEFIRLAEFVVIPKERYADKITGISIVRDKYDRHILACAEEAKCDYIVTGDKDLLSLREYKGISIIKSKEYLKIVKKG
jgi:putative PIN family toxin of toxin-antitoxin system